MRHLAATLVCSILGFAASTASAQTIYEPLRVRYGGQNPYYYGGCSQLVHEAAAYPSLPGSTYGRRDGFAFTSYRRAVVEREPRVFADFRGPHGNPLTDLTVSDIVNAAHARMPKYFTKDDAVESARQVKPNAADAADVQRFGRRGSITIVAYRRGEPTTRPATQGK